MLKMSTQELLKVIRQFLNVMAYFGRCTNYSTDDKVTLSHHGNVYALKPPCQQPKPLAPMHMKQRSEEWFSMRKLPLTGSSLFEALGLDTLKKQKAHITKVCHFSYFL